MIISNNRSTDTTSEILDQIKDERLKVVSPSVRLPLAVHYEFALSHASGEWVTIIGDDDALMPNFFEDADRLIEEFPHINVIKTSRAYFFWPGCEDLYGEFAVNYSSGNEIKLRSCLYDMGSVLLGFRSCFDLPQIYTTSITKSSLIKEIKKKSQGIFYQSVSPDMYSAVAICLSEKRYLYVSKPLFWVGTSAKSVSRKENRGSSDTITQSRDFYTRVPRDCSNLIPRELFFFGFPSLFIYESLLQCPFKPSWANSLLLRTIVLAAVLNSSRKIKNLDKALFIEKIWEDGVKHGLSKNLIVISAYLLWTVATASKFLSLSGRCMRRLGIGRSKIEFRSTERAMFPTILDASRKVMELQAEEGKSRS